MRRTAHHFFSTRGKTLPLSTLLLAALCVLLAAPSSHAASGREYSREAILSVLERGEISASVLNQVLAPRTLTSQLSVLEIRKLRAMLAELDQSQLVELQKQLISCSALEREAALSQPLPDSSEPRPEYSAAPSFCPAHEIVARTSRYLE